MSLKQLTKEQIREMAMVEVAYELFLEGKKPYVFSDLVKEIASHLGLTKKQVEEKIAQFYTDMNIDGRFICVGENMWGLRTWYPYEQIEEEIVPVAKPKKKKAKKKAAKADIEDFDDVEEVEYDELDGFDDADEEDDDDFDDLDDTDLDDDDDDLVEDDDDFDLDEDDDEDDDDDDLDEEEEEK